MGKRLGKDRTVNPFSATREGTCSECKGHIFICNPIVKTPTGWCHHRCGTDKSTIDHRRVTPGEDRFDPQVSTKRTCRLPGEARVRTHTLGNTSSPLATTESLAE